MRWYRAVGIAVVMALAVATPAAAASENDTSAGSMAETFIDLARDAMGEDPALVALRTRDNGYDVSQTLDAIGDEDQEIAADGTITQAGRPVTPAEPPTGVIEREGEGEVVDAIDQIGDLLAKKKSLDPPDEYVEDGTMILVILLGLMAEGYTTEQIIVDGLLAGGIDAVPFAGVQIVDEKGDVITPGDQASDDPLVETIVNDMVTIVEGYDPLDPTFKARYDVKYNAELAMADATATVTAKGTLGTDPSGEVYLGRMKGKMAIPASEKCAAETVLVVITLRGDVVKSGRPTTLDQSWGYRGSKGGGGEGFCISAAEAPQLVGLVPGSIGPLEGVVKPGGTLTSLLKNATLTIQSKK